jgi:hypothetical protein
MQDVYLSWLNSPYSGQNPRFNLKDPVRCQDCHMPKVVATDPSADKTGRISSHRFIGANTLNAILSDTSTQLDETVRFLQSNKIRIAIDKPNQTSAVQNYKPLENQLRDYITAPYFFTSMKNPSLILPLAMLALGIIFLEALLI